MENGDVISSGEDLSKCVKFSIYPDNGVSLPTHDIIGVKMKRRFCRGFINALGGGIKDYLHCIVCDGFRIYISSIKGTFLITPEDYEVYI